MKIYDNGKDIERQDFIERGFVASLIEDSEQNLKDECELENLGNLNENWQSSVLR